MLAECLQMTQPQHHLFRYVPQAYETTRWNVADGSL